MYMGVTDGRGEPRIRSQGVVEILLPDQSSVSGRICDVSPNGMSVYTPVQVATQIPVQIDCMGLIAQAVVRHCATSGELFRVGLELVASETSQ